MYQVLKVTLNTFPVFLWAFKIIKIVKKNNMLKSFQIFSKARMAFIFNYFLDNAN